MRKNGKLFDECNVFGDEIFRMYYLHNFYVEITINPNDNNNLKKIKSHENAEEFMQLWKHLRESDLE